MACGFCAAAVAGGDDSGNPYAGTPFRVVFFSLTRRCPQRAVVFLGGVPARVLAAARRAKPGGRWDPKDASVLKEHYGAGWRALLAFDGSAFDGEGFDGEGFDAETLGGEGYGESYDGGGEGFEAFAAEAFAAEAFAAEAFGDLRALNALDEDGTVVLEAAATEAASEAEELVAEEASEGTVYSDLDVFPEDTLQDLREKLYLATGVPPYRQHLFWLEEDPLGLDPPQVRGAYRLYVAGVLRTPDPRRFGREEDLLVAGLPVDQALAAAAARGEVFVEARDSFATLGALAVATVYAADLDELITPASRRRELAAAVQDAMKADYIYSGLVLKYWPQLSADACRRLLAGASPAEMAAAYPRLLGRPRPAQRYALQGAILRDVHARAAAVRGRWGGDARAQSVTAATAAVPAQLPPGGWVNLRNVLDLHRTSPAAPAAAARFYLAAPGRGRQDVTVEKRHASAALGGNADADEIARVLARPLRRGSLVVLLRAGAEAAAPGWRRGRARLAVVTLHESGAYEVEGGWPEDAGLRPDAAAEAFAAIAAPFVAAVNAMGALAFPAGGRLALLGADAAPRLRSMAAVCFWPQVLTERGARELKRRLRGHEEAGLIAVRGLQQAGAYAFQYLKGVVDYDPRAIERTVVVSGAAREVSERTLNTYAYLTSDEVARRWDQLYGGRAVRLTVRSADVKLEFEGMSAAELERAWTVLFAFFDGLVRGPDRLAAADLACCGAAADRRRGLKALQDSDPVLYDLRRHDARAPVYSVLCQNPRPPSAFSPEEAAALPARRRARLERYWNFTENRPAFYECPSPRFPHLSFLEGRHPLGYCLPCCQKTAAHAGSRRDRFNRHCLAAADGADGADGADDGDGAAADGRGRHTLAYGKRVPPGRTAALPPLLGLLGGGLLLGVPQSLPALPAARVRAGAPPGGGYFHAVAAAVGVEAAHMGADFAAAAAALGEGYVALARGRAGLAFASAAALVDALVATFARPGAPFTALSPGGDAHAIWEPLVNDLARACYGVGVVSFEDPEGAGEVTAVLDEEAAAFCTGGDGPLVLVCKVGHPDAKRGGGGVYPVVGEDGGSPFAAASEAAAAVRTLVRASAAEGAGWTLERLAAHLAGPGRAFAARTKLVGRRGLCYGAVLAAPSGGTVYVPVAYSPAWDRDALSRGTPGLAVHAGPWGDHGSASDLEAFLATFPEKAGFRPVCALRGAGGKYVGLGLRLAAAPREVLYFYHAPAAAPLRPGLPEVELPAMPHEVDRVLWADRLRGAPLVAPAALREAFRASLYRRFLAEYVALLYARRDPALRAEIEAAFRGGVSALRALRLKLGEDDFALARGARGRLDEVSFAADRRTLDAAGLRAAMAARVELVPRAQAEAAYAALPAAYAACSAVDDQAGCAAGRLLVPAEDFDALLDVLHADLRNPLKAAILPFQASGVFDDMAFQRYPDERVEIRL